MWETEKMPINFVYFYRKCRRGVNIEFGQT